MLETITEEVLKSFKSKIINETFLSVIANGFCCAECGLGEHWPVLPGRSYSHQPAVSPAKPGQQVCSLGYDLEIIQNHHAAST